MATVSTQFTSLTTVGGLLPADFLLRVAEGRGLAHTAPADYRVVGSRGVDDAAERRWSYLLSAWRELRKAGMKLPAELKEGEALSDPSGRARDEWLLPLFDELGYGGLPTVAGGGIAASDDDGRTSFPITHQWGHVPIQLVNWATDIDDRSAYALTQECLNRSDDNLWGIVSNGRTLRLLRDNSALSGPAYVEFNLADIFEGELVADFVLLYRLLHATRFRTEGDAPASTCVLETWRGEAIRTGVRALDQLRDGVETAIQTLGTGFLAHRANKLDPDDTRLDKDEFHHAVLRLTYRLLFWFVAEERGVLHTEDTDSAVLERYREYFSSARLRSHARKRRGSRHVDLFQGVRFVLDGLGDEEGLETLGLPGLGGIFDRTEGDRLLIGKELSNEALLAAVRSLAAVYDKGARRWRAIDYRHLDAEELGSVYESLLERVPQFVPGERRFVLETLAGNERKTTGSYYTPSSLIEKLLDTTLDPVIDAAEKKGGDDRKAIIRELLSLKVCDPACGSGHFLVASARRIAKRVASVRHETPEPTLEETREALREVIGRCIYGVDLNPMAVELAKVALWMEAMVPGMPLGFLDAHVKRGNALIGAYPKLMNEGIPDDAWTAIEGDDKAVARELKRDNRKQRASGQIGLFGIGAASADASNTGIAAELLKITQAPARDLRAVHAQEADYRIWKASQEVAKRRLLADTWCAAFFWPKQDDGMYAPTEQRYRELAADIKLPMDTEAEVRRLAEEYAFFHWHLEFPEVFEVPDHGLGAEEQTGWTGGFSAVVGNPPWERIKLQEQEFFSQRHAEIAEAPNAAARKRMIATLSETNSTLYQEFERAKREASGQSHFTKASKRFPLTGTGDINTYSVFTETDRALTGHHGRTGVIVPTGIATDATTQHFFKDLVTTGSLVAVHGFENESLIFPEVHHAFKFCLLVTAGGGLREPEAEFVFYARSTSELDDADRTFNLSPDEITLLNPNTGTCPVFRSRRDADLALEIYEPPRTVLIRDGVQNSNPWQLDFQTRLIHMAEDSELFFDADNATRIPVYEAKMMHHFDHRWATYDDGTIRDLGSAEKQSPSTAAIPRYWVSSTEVTSRLTDKGWNQQWLLGWRDITLPTNERTAISCILPPSAASHTIPIMFPLLDPPTAGVALTGIMNSFILDYCTRIKLGGTHLQLFTLKQLPFLSPEVVKPHLSFITARVLELTYTTYDMAPFARDVGDDGPPFVWNDDRRFVIRAELDALFFHLYGITREDVDYIMETFPIVKRKDIAAHGTFRTKDYILKYYDQMAAAGVSTTVPPVDGENFTSELTPPPGHGPRHPAEEG
ncbi:Eco57I restriction-modification methylase domain-containing protein [Phytomonospora endophytica]|uniref:site-specific DNA-methyltransferase (adenine-specific) n=1 Tax=Phytomonospora endophytica TaxID=714109 RepID=A0A841FH81_9ACTN|nr:DNA methyltransferase [Phytomonospora endophytica]MBB6032922.1 hypothetical protein [Phytomonospora endophytica]GIG65149.1 hypothetical protein Pen01_14440 [Phytomonospora endophytica]